VESPQAAFGGADLKRKARPAFVAGHATKKLLPAGNNNAAELSKQYRPLNLKKIFLDR
jgi:hypothetical protein